jgi:hypothetical protein
MASKYLSHAFSTPQPLPEIRQHIIENVSPMLTRSGYQLRSHARRGIHVREGVLVWVGDPPLHRAVSPRIARPADRQGIGSPQCQPRPRRDRTRRASCSMGRFARPCCAAPSRRCRRLEGVLWKRVGQPQRRLQMTVPVRRRAGGGRGMRRGKAPKAGGPSSRPRAANTWRPTGGQSASSPIGRQVTQDRATPPSARTRPSD